METTSTARHASTAGNPSASTGEATCASTVKVAADVTTIHSTAKCRVSAKGRHATVVAASTIEARTAMETMEPRPGANKDSAGKPLGPIVAIGCAGVRVIVIVAVRAHRSGPYNHRPHSHSEADLGAMSVGREHQAKTQYRQNS